MEDETLPEQEKNTTRGGEKREIGGKVNHAKLLVFAGVKRLRGK